MRQVRAKINDERRNPTRKELSVGFKGIQIRKKVCKRTKRDRRRFLEYSSSLSIFINFDTRRTGLSLNLRHGWVLIHILTLRSYLTLPHKSLEEFVRKGVLVSYLLEI